MNYKELIFELIDSFKEVHSSEKILNYENPITLSNVADLSLGNKNDRDRISELMDQYINYSVKTGHKQYLNQLFAGFNQAGLVGELLAVLMNTSMYTFEVAPLATLIEKEVIEKMNSYTGFSKGDGIFTTGGSNSNMVAMLCARHNMFPEVKEKGLFNTAPISLFVSQLAHYSFQKAAYTLGIGSDCIYGIKTNEKGEIIPEKLEEAIALSKSKGEQPFFVAATAGTTELGAFDNIEVLGDIARKNALWFHVDGSWGGSLILSKKYKYLFNGLEKANSFAWNAHKLMNTPLIASVLLLNDPSILHNATTSGKTDYIFHDHDFKQYDLGTKSLQCGRRNDALKVWFAWKSIGDEQYEKNINKLMDLAKYAEQIIENHPSLEMLAPVQSLNVNFRFNQSGIQNLNQFNKELRNELLESGQIMVNYCHLGDIISIRLALVNHDLEKEDLDHFFTTFANSGIEKAKKHLGKLETIN